MNLPPRPEFRLHVGGRTIKTAFTAALVAIGVIEGGRYYPAAGR